MNNCSFIGRLTADPELKHTSSGISVCSFTLAVNRPRVKDTTDFINFQAWRQSAEYLCKYGHKGDMVAVNGTLTSRKWQDKDGNNRTAFDVVADSLSVIGGKSNQTAQGNVTPLPNQNAQMDAFAAKAQAQGIDIEEYEGDETLPF